MVFKSGQFGDAWSAVVSKGSQYEFNENVWGAMTRRYLIPIQELSAEQFQLIVDDTAQFVKKGKVVTTFTPAVMEDDAYEELFSFR